MAGVVIFIVGIVGAFVVGVSVGLKLAEPEVVEPDGRTPKKTGRGVKGKYRVHEDPTNNTIHIEKWYDHIDSWQRVAHAEYETPEQRETILNHAKQYVKRGMKYGEGDVIFSFEDILEEEKPKDPMAELDRQLEEATQAQNREFYELGKEAKRE